MTKLEWMDAFAEFGVDLNFTHAAHRLHLSQPALHAQIRKLGESLGVTLYERRGRQLVLTEDGTRVLRFARETRERSDRFVASLHGRTAMNPVVVAAGEGALLYLLGDAIRAFGRQSDSPLRLLSRSAEPAVEAVLRGDAHLAVTVIAEPPDELQTRVVAEVRQIALLPGGHRLACAKSIRINDLAEESFIVPSTGSALRESIASALAQSDDSLTVAVEASGWEPMLHFAEMGLGIAVVNECCRVPRGLVAVPIRDLPRLKYRLLHAPNALDDPAVDLAAELIWRHREAWARD